MLSHGTFVFNASLCTGCKACMIACKDKHNLPLGIHWRRVMEYAGGQWTVGSDNTYTQNVFAYYISLSCNHCEDAKCVDVCPTQAMHKDSNGIVSVDENLCVGCRLCEHHCPYDAPQFNHMTKKMTKCDFCRDALEEGKDPTCISACPARALDYGQYTETAKKYGHFSTMAPLPAPELTKPHFFCIPHGEARPVGSDEGSHGAFASNPDEF